MFSYGFDVSFPSPRLGPLVDQLVNDLLDRGIPFACTVLLKKIDHGRKVDTHVDATLVAAKELKTVLQQVFYSELCLLTMVVDKLLRRVLGLEKRPETLPVGLDPAVSPKTDVLPIAIFWMDFSHGAGVRSNYFKFNSLLAQQSVQLL